MTDKLYDEYNSDKYDVQYKDGLRIVIAKFHDNCESKIGQFLEDNDYDIIVNEDTDFYSKPLNDITGNEAVSVGEDEILFKLRKGVFNEEEQLGAYEGLIGAAQPSENRGLAAGPKVEKLGGRAWVTGFQYEILEHFINSEESLFSEEDPIQRLRDKYADGAYDDNRGMVWLLSKVTDAGYNYSTFFEDKIEEWLAMSRPDASVNAKFTKDGMISITSYANSVLSGLAGFFDRYPRIPYGRATAYTESNYETYKKCYPFTISLAKHFKELLPRRFAYQNDKASLLDERFRVAGKDTPFTTITVNKNFRTAAHRDAGDLNDGFSNLTVIAKDKEWEGGMLVLPEWRVAINIRPGDLLLINNHAGIHGNTKLVPPEGKTLADMERISLVIYFREKMLLLGDKDYEDLRRQYVDSRRKNKDHPLWRKLWNGVSASMWDKDEWYDYLRNNNGEPFLAQYHPKAVEDNTSLDEFF